MTMREWRTAHRWVTTIRCRPRAGAAISRRFVPCGSHGHCSPCGVRGLATAVSAAELQFGQPLHETHPHLLQAGELTPGITALEYAERRARLAAKLPPNSIAVLAAAETKFRSGSVFYDFSQECNFFYLTGFDEPESLAVIARGSRGDEDHAFHLFVRPKDPAAEIWEGSRSGLDAATDVFNADATGSSEQLSRHLKPLLASAAEIYTDIPSRLPSPSILSRLLPSSSSTGSGNELSKLLDAGKVKPLKPLVHELRMFKSVGEIANMQRAGLLSGQAFNAAMRRRWTHEKDLADFLEYRFKRLGCQRSAYIPVVAGGRNAHTIHYVRNDDRLQAGDLALVDAGGAVGGYITDITRTFPVDGKFSAPQRDLYEAVLDVQKTCVALCRADANLSLDKLHGIAERELRAQLRQLGFDFGGSGSLEKLFPHHLGHYIGLDVHDCPGASRRDALRTNQCVTIEPGIYVPGDDERWPEAFRGLGIRIEDSIVVQDSEPLVLTSEAKKEVADIEALRAEDIPFESAQNLR